jgi:hypothetical protein
MRFGAALCWAILSLFSSSAWADVSRAAGRECAIFSNIDSFSFDLLGVDKNFAVDQRVATRGRDREVDVYLIAPTRNGLDSCGISQYFYSLVISTKDGSGQRSYSNLQSDDWNGLAKISARDSGFSLLLKYGSTVKCDLNIYFSTANNSLHIEKTSRICNKPNEYAVRSTLTRKTFGESDSLSLDGIIKLHDQALVGRTGTILASKARIYSAPRLSGAKKSYLVAGDLVAVEERLDDDWIAFSYKGGRSKGWLRAADVSPR